MADVDIHRALGLQGWERAWNIEDYFAGWETIVTDEYDGLTFFFEERYVDFPSLDEETRQNSATGEPNLKAAQQASGAAPCVAPTRIVLFRTCTTPAAPTDFPSFGL
jgi:hypothetical protein